MEYLILCQKYNLLCEDVRSFRVKKLNQLLLIRGASCCGPNQQQAAVANELCQLDWRYVRHCS
jgi:hypothetical protein